ncbi:MAG TPA: hypothetical protein VJ950_12475, partial [Acidimicrobiia bacterium]|nr:hypothetical protein [Acidimicrobiia bacterium]
MGEEQLSKSLRYNNHTALVLEDLDHRLGGGQCHHEPDDPPDARLFRRRWLRTAQVPVDLEKLLSGHLTPGVANTDRIQ